MRHGVIRAGQTSWDAAEQYRWRQDAMPELHNDDALWAFAMRASEEYRQLDRQQLNDETLYRLLDMGIHDWKKPDTLLHQAQQAIRWGAATSTRSVNVRDKVDFL